DGDADAPPTALTPVDAVAAEKPTPEDPTPEDPAPVAPAENAPTSAAPTLKQTAPNARPTTAGSRLRALLADADDAAQRADWNAAEGLYQRALRVAPGNPEATRGLEAARAARRDADFGETVTGVLAALDGADWAAARTALDAAEAAHPGAPQLGDIRRRLEIAERRSALDDLNRRADDAARGEEWQLATTLYDAMLGVDPHLRSAQEGRERAAKMAAIHAQMAAHLASPQRLSDPAVLDEAAVALARARESGGEPGPRLQARIVALDAVITGYAQPVDAELTSDAATEVTIYRVGQLGSFAQRRLSLRPGVYTVLGSRPGFRDVRFEWVIKPGESPEPLDVRCEERL
ncbi:MAG: hypothetical protein AAFY88_24110, partial [Acidobacteriota bacterium]